VASANLTFFLILIYGVEPPPSGKVALGAYLAVLTSLVEISSKFYDYNVCKPTDGRNGIFFGGNV